MYIFVDSPMLSFRKTYILDICLNRLTKAILTNTQNMNLKKKLVKSIRQSCFRWVHIKFLYNSKFYFVGKSLETNTVVITRVLCISITLCYQEMYININGQVCSTTFIYQEKNVFAKVVFLLFSFYNPRNLWTLINLHIIKYRMISVYPIHTYC